MTVRALPAPTELPGDAFETSVDGAGCGAMTSERGNLPLETLDVRAAITGLAARVVLSQGFRNPHAEPIEATYVFPLPDRAAVTGLRMEADGRIVDAVLKERGEARAEYHQAITEGRRASIAEEERPDVFTMRVGNVLPGETVTVRLTLDQPLPWSDGEATFRFPLVVAPRYIPGEALGDPQTGSGHAPDTAEVPDASRISPPVLLPGFPNPVALSITADVDPAGLPLGGVRSSLHTVVAEGSTYRAQPGERVDRDFVLRLTYGMPEEATHSLVLTRDTPAADGAGDHADDREGTFQLTVLPPRLAAPARPRDVVVVLDRSGSMHGWKMVAARRAAARIVDTLNGHDRFAVLAFDNHIERPELLPPGLVAATDRNRFRAVEHLATMRARGGTEMLRPLQEAVGLLTDAERDRVLVLVTDGQVGNEDQIVSVVQPGLAGVRVHTVGIDRAVNAGFLGRLAVLGGGRCELVESENRLDEAADHLHRRIGTPLVADIAVTSTGATAGRPDGASRSDLASDVGDTGAATQRALGVTIIDGTMAPARLPALVPGVPLVVTGRWRGSPGALTVSGVAADGSPWRATVDADSVTDAPAVGAVWARAHLRDLEDAYLTADPGSLGETERRIVETSLRFGVLCRFTAYVAVDARVVTDGSSPHQIVQPVEQPSGWEMLPGGPPPMPMSARARAGGAAPAPYAAMSAYDGGAPMMFGDAEGAAAAAPAGGGGFATKRTSATGTPRGHIARPAPMSSPAPVSSPAHTPDPLLWAREQAASELRLLRAAEPLSVAQRWIALSDLASRLQATAVALAAPGMPPVDDVRAEIAAVAEAVRRGGPALVDALWRRAIDALKRLATVGGPGIASPVLTPTPPATTTSGPAPSAPAEGSRRRLFWKR